MEAITDTHLHLVDRNRLGYGWLAGAPALDRDWTLAEYADQARKVGIARAIHMEVDVDDADIGNETGMVEEAAASGVFPIVGIIAACRPERDTFAAELERAQGRPLVVGFRRVLHVVDDDVSQTPTFRDNVRRLAGTGLTFDLCVLARQLPLATALVDAAPEVRFVVDHCGVPDIAGGAFDAWARDLAEIARRPNVCAKVSGIVAYAAPGWSLPELSRWTTHVVDAFGFDRLVWGGDWPVCTLGGGLPVWVAATRALFATASADERAALYEGNARTVYGI